MHICSSKGMFKNVQGSTIHNSTQMERNQCPQTVRDIITLWYNNIGNTMQQWEWVKSSIFLNNVGETNKHSVEPKKPDIGKTYCMIPLIQCPKPDQIYLWYRTRAHACLCWGRCWWRQSLKSVMRELPKSWSCSISWSSSWMTGSVHFMKINPSVHLGFVQHCYV